MGCGHNETESEEHDKGKGMKLRKDARFRNSVMLRPASLASRRTYYMGASVENPHFPRKGRATNGAPGIFILPQCAAAG